MAKNIEMSVLGSDGSYEVLYPATISNITYLTDAVSTLFDLAEGSSLDEALIRLLVGTDGYGYIITLKYPDGTPASGLTLSGITSINGGNPVTDSNGWAFGKSNETTVTIGMSGVNWLDVDFSSFQVQSTGTITSYNHTIPYRSDDYILRVTSSKNYNSDYFSPFVTSTDICAVGGGGGGACGGGGFSSLTGGYDYTGGGGGGGYVTNKTILDVSRGIKITIGSGGSRFDATGDQDSYQYAGNGGSTIVLYYNNNENILSSNGGNGGSSSFVASSSYQGIGGTGNGRGGNGNSIGENGSGYIFNDSSLGLAGGGGGAGGVDYSNKGTSNMNPLTGGNPNGADGGLYGYWVAGDVTKKINATTPGYGGGGGGAPTRNQNSWPRASSGGSGIVYLRFHH